MQTLKSTRRGGYAQGAIENLRDTILVLGWLGLVGTVVVSNQSKMHMEMKEDVYANDYLVYFEYSC
jgi:hypothetical protein